MRNKKIIVVLAALALLGTIIFLYMISGRSRIDEQNIREIKPVMGSIQSIISTTGTVYPKNRLEIKPPVAGRVEKILVQEGDYVKAGQTLAFMSSTERAALLDAARNQGEDALKYWQEVYKAISLISPIDGEVIVETTQPGQTVTTSDAVIVLSDQLIVRAQVDETDIGKVKLGQNADIILDAYPNTKIKATVGHIYYESETVNNVTIYKVDLVPENVPQFFRSGMNATVEFHVENKDGVLIVPVNAVRKENEESYVLLKQEGSQNPLKRAVRLGITDDKNYEVLSGITSADTIIVTTKKYVFPTSGTGSNPFLPRMHSAKKTAPQK